MKTGGLRRPAALPVVSLLAAALLLAACGSGGAGGGSAGGGERVLNVFNWSEYLPDSVLAAFEAEFGVRVNYDVYSSNEELMAKLQAGGQGLYDVAVPSDYTAATMIELGLVEPLDFDRLPNVTQYLVDDLRDPVYDPGGRYTVPYMWGTTGLAYNTAQVGKEITDWADIFDPAFEDRILLLDDMPEVMAIGLWMNGLDPSSTDPADIEAARRTLEELMPLVKAFDSDTQSDYLLSGEVWIAQAYSGEAALAIMEDPDITYVLPAGGCSYWVDVMVIPAGAPNPDLAHEFINFLYRPEIAAQIAEEYPYATPNGEALSLLSEEVLGNPAAYPPEDQLARCVFLTDPGEASELYAEAFTELKLRATE